jgi:hypothetical protein
VVANEPAPILDASTLIKPEFLVGPHHKVLETVRTQGFANQYTVETKWGIHPVWGNDLLLKRIHEFDAIVRLEGASKSDEFKSSLRKAAASPFYALGGALQDPKGAAKGIAQGAGRFISRAGEALQRGGKKAANTDSALEGMLGMSQAKRDIAKHLNVDPYTDNQILQGQLDEMAKASFAGGFVIKAGTFALSAGAGMGAASWAGNLALADQVSDMIHDKSPLDLSQINRETLMALGVSEQVAVTFVEHPNISPTQQTTIAVSLKALGPVGGIEEFIKMTQPCQSSADAQFFSQCASLIAEHHTTRSPLKRVLNLYGLPSVHDSNNDLVIPLAVDYVAWTPETQRLATSITEYQPQVDIARRILVLTGDITPLARTQLEARGFVVQSRMDDRLYKPAAPAVTP